MRVRERQPEGAARCPFCRELLGDPPPTPCGGCGVRLHAACAAELGRCPTVGCGALEPAPAPVEGAEGAWTVAREERRRPLADPWVLLGVVASAVVGVVVARRAFPEAAELIVGVIALLLGSFGLWFVIQTLVGRASSRPLARRVRLHAPGPGAPVRVAVDWAPAALEGGPGPAGLQRLAVRCLPAPGSPDHLYGEVRVVRPTERRVVELPPAPSTLKAHPGATWTIDLHPVQGLGGARFTVAPEA